MNTTQNNLLVNNFLSGKSWPAGRSRGPGWRYQNSLLTVLMVFVCFLSVEAQQRKFSELRERATRNLAYLSNDFIIQSRVQIDSKGIILYTDEYHTEVDVSMTWKELSDFAEAAENITDFYETDAYAKQAKDKSYQKVYREQPTVWKGLRVALDPGHFGGNLEEAVYEDRYVKIQGKDVGEKDDLVFYEADLNYGICLLLKAKLEKKGAVVLITRPYGFSAVGKSFQTWFGTDYKKQLDSAFKTDAISKDLYDLLNDSAVDKKFVFENFYKFLEFRTRSKKILEFRPDITFAVHCNAREGNKRYGNHYLMPVRENYNMAFIPGGFLSDELSKTDQKNDFLRLLVTRDLENSMRLASLLITSLEKTTGVPAIPKSNDLRVVRDYSVATPGEGVYCRNLYLTRSPRGAVVYGETLYQDNVGEIKVLAKKDLALKYEGKDVMVSHRCEDIANGYFDTVDLYLRENLKTANR